MKRLLFDQSKGEFHSAYLYQMEYGGVWEIGISKDQDGYSYVVLKDGEFFQGANAFNTPDLAVKEANLVISLNEPNLKMEI